MTIRENTKPKDDGRKKGWRKGEEKRYQQVLIIF